MASDNFIMNENDLESPGYEYLRSYHNMNSLYQKLLILNYQEDFCSIYRCPPIHKYYFAMPSKNQTEQQYLFTCLCAWLIKNKCQMNLELEPEEYEDRELTLSVIVEALKLLLTPDDDLATRGSSKNMIGFAPSRLGSGFGPEVIWTINILADRALEVLSETIGDERVGTEIIYHSASSGNDVNPTRSGSETSITIGQPFVGGGLTTRPLGSYQVDDSSLLFEDTGNSKSETSTDFKPSDLDPVAWYRRVEMATPALSSANLAIEDNIETKDWRIQLESIAESTGAIEEFLKDSKYLLDPILTRVDKQMQMINEREKLIQVKLKGVIEEFLMIWRAYSLESTHNSELLEQINGRTDKFEQYNDRLRRLNCQIESRIKELNDGSRLKELDLVKNRLQEDTDDLDIRIGLLLTVYAKKHRKIISESDNNQ